MCLGWGVASAVTVWLQGPLWLSTLLGFGTTLVIPGYLLVAAAGQGARGMSGPGSPQGDGTSGLWLLRVILSIAITVGVGLTLDLIGPGISQGSLVAALLLVIFALFIRARHVARRRVAAPVRTPPAPGFQERWAGLEREGRAQVLVVAALALLVTGLLLSTILIPREPEPFVQFYVLGADGNADCYPDAWDGRYVLSESSTQAGCSDNVGNVTVGLVNHEGHSSSYVIRTTWDRGGEGDGTLLVADEWNVTLPHVPAPLGRGETVVQHERSFALPPPPFEGLQQLRFQLFDAPASMEPRHELHIWIDAQSTAAPS